MHFNLHPEFYKFVFRRNSLHCKVGDEGYLFKPISVFRDSTGEIFCILRCVQTNTIHDYRLTDMIICL